MYQTARADVSVLLAPEEPLTADLTAFDLQVTMKIRYINLATGATEAPSQFYNKPHNGMSYTYFAAPHYPGGCFASGAMPELRFSNSVCSISTSLSTSGGSNLAWQPLSSPLESVSTADLPCSVGSFPERLKRPCLCIVRLHDPGTRFDRGSERVHAEQLDPYNR